jgi:hypothetical protein
MLRTEMLPEVLERVVKLPREKEEVHAYRTIPTPLDLLRTKPNHRLELLRISPIKLVIRPVRDQLRRKIPPVNNNPTQEHPRIKEMLQETRHQHHES